MIRDSFSAVLPRYAKITGIRSIIIYPSLYQLYKVQNSSDTTRLYVYLQLQTGFAGCLLTPEPE
jgi:hypothetical protein